MFAARHIIQRGALLLVNLLLLGYLGFLLVNLYRSHEQIQKSSLIQIQHVVEKRAVALESFLQDRREDLVDLAEKQQIQAYFENLSLGMSLEYGLGASLSEFNAVLERYRLRKQLDGKPLYRKILFVERSGKVLASSVDNNEQIPVRSLLIQYASDGISKINLENFQNHPNPEIVFSHPYRFKGALLGYIISWISIKDLHRHFIESMDDKSNRSISLLHDRKRFLSPVNIACEGLQLPKADELRAGKQEFKTSQKSAKSSLSNLTSVTIPIDGSPLHLTNFNVNVPSGNVSSMQLVVTTAGIGVLIILGSVVLVRADMNTRVVETRLKETRLREEATEAQNKVLTATTEKLQESRERLSLALEGADLGFWDWNVVSGQVVYSERWASMLGFNLDDIEPTIATWERLVHPDDKPFVEELLQRHLSGATSFYEAEHRCQTKNGSWRWILDRGRVVERLSDGTPLRMAGTHLDITARKFAEEKLRQLNEELEARVQDEVAKNREKDAYMLQHDKLASIGQLAAGVAHEINNPIGFVMSNLSTLKGYSRSMIRYIEILERHSRLPTDAPMIAELRKTLDIDYIVNDIDPLLDESLDGSDRVKQIVSNLKDFARLDESSVVEADLNQCVRSTVNIVRNELKYVAQLDLKLSEIPLVKCNPQQINQVIANLLVNAAQAITGHGTIIVNTRQEDNEAVLEISDTGAGIPEELLKRIFDPFFTTKPVGKGTGLGLTISYDIVKKNGGDISVTSEVGKGTVFTIRLPSAVQQEKGDAKSHLAG